MVLQKLDVYVQKENGPVFFPLLQPNSIWIEDLIMESETND